MRATGFVPSFIGSQRYMEKSSLADASRSTTLPCILAAFSNLSRASALFPSSDSGTSFPYSK